MVIIRQLAALFPAASKYFISRQTALIPTLFKSGRSDINVIPTVKAFFHRHPMIANSLSMGGLYIGAELSQQTLNFEFKKWLRVKSDCTENHDLKLEYRWRQAMNFFLIGAVIYAPLFRIWYKWLDAKFVGTTATIVAKKCFLDQFMLGPPCLALFFVTMNVLERNGDVLAEAKKKFWYTFAIDCTFWIPVQAMNFLFVSPTFRVLYLGIASFAWLNILCVVKNIESYQKELELY